MQNRQLTYKGSIHKFHDFLHILSFSFIGALHESIFAYITKTEQSRLSTHGDLDGALHKLESYPGSMGNFLTCLTLYILQN